MAAISRIDGERTHGWQAKAHQGNLCQRAWCPCRNGMRSKFFADAKCGSKSLAFGLAMQWVRDFKQAVMRAARVAGVPKREVNLRDYGRRK